MNQSKQVATGMRGSSCWFMPSSPFPPLEITRVSTLQTFASSNLQYDFYLCTRGAITRCRNAYAFRRRFVAPTHHRKRPGPESAVPQTPAINNHTAWTRGPPRASLPAPALAFSLRLSPTRNSHRDLKFATALIPPAPRPRLYSTRPTDQAPAGAMEAGGDGRREAALGALAVLPDEVLCAVVDLLPPADIGRLACVSRYPHPPACCPPSAASSSSTLGIAVSLAGRESLALNYMSRLAEFCGVETRVGFVAW